MKRFITLLVLISVSLFFVSCDTINSSKDLNEKESVDIGNIDVPDNFNFSTIAQKMITLEVLTSEESPIADIHFYICETEEDAEIPEETSIAHGFTDDNGVYSQAITIPTYLDSIYIVGFMKVIRLSTENDVINFTYGGASSSRYANSGEVVKTRATDKFHYLQDYDVNGRPVNLDFEPLSADFLQRVNEVLPERKNLPNLKPEFFDNVNHNIEILQDCNVSVIFVSEGAGYRNSLGFTKYQTNNPPASIDIDSDTLNIIFPHCSTSGNWGGPPYAIFAGDKMDIGSFQAGETIDFFLVENGWRANSATQGVSNTRKRYFTTPEYNPEPSINEQVHTVLLNDIESSPNRFLLGFEDVLRTRSGCDHDFNDCVFYIVAEPINSINEVGIPTVGNVVNPDEDGDGVPDEFDDYPNNSERAFNNFYPGENEKATLAFEDQWPSKGDFDFNDIVIDYNFLNVHDPDNKLMEIHASFTLKAIGAKYHNGFSFEVPFGMTLVDTAKINADYVSIDGNIVTVFDDAFHLIQPTQNFVNTINAESPISPVDISFWLKLDTHYEYVAGDYLPPYNPFIIANTEVHDITYEIHLCDYPPTSRADETVFGTMDDDSDLPAGRTYRTATNLPWAVHLSSEWKYPSENSVITDAYYYFDEWAGSGGVEHPDWYLYNDDNVNDDYLYLAQ